jgi:hypothetical protein
LLEEKIKILRSFHALFVVVAMVSVWQSQKIRGES